MKTHFIEVTNREQNWGKFLLIQFDSEWEYDSQMSPGRPLLRQIGFNPNAIWVLDLQTCEGAAFVPGGLASADLHKHRVWVCPMFEPFLNWLYQQKIKSIEELPGTLDLEDAEFAMWGYRREGPTESK